MWETFLNMPAAALAAFLGGALVLNLAPGADVLFATASGAQGGPKAGAAAGLGTGAGGLVHALAAALGLGALIAAQPGAIGAIRWFGAGYLLWLAWRSWHAGGAEAQGGLRSPVAAFRRGFLTNILNPKVILFMIAWLPQFTDPAWGPVWQQMLLLGGAFCVSGTVVTVGYGLVAGWLGARLARRMRVMNRVASVMFAGLAARLVAA